LPGIVQGLEWGYRGFLSSAACGAIRQFDPGNTRRNAPEYATLRRLPFDPTMLSYRHAFLPAITPMC